jgi:catechol 2,3-dioxygenase-like lactoylglutathione lyase family enzyme
VGVTVTDLRRSLSFYQEILGMEQMFVTESSGPEISELVDVSGAHIRLAALRTGNNIIVELLEYVAPEGRPYDRRNCDTGSCHLGLEVPDIEASYQGLLEKGVHFNGPPLHVKEGPLAGHSFAYFRDPDGFQMELVQRP